MTMTSPSSTLILKLKELDNSLSKLNNLRCILLSKRLRKKQTLGRWDSRSLLGINMHC